MTCSTVRTAYHVSPDSCMIRWKSACPCGMLLTCIHYIHTHKVIHNYVCIYIYIYTIFMYIMQYTMILTLIRISSRLPRSSGEGHILPHSEMDWGLLWPFLQARKGIINFTESAERVDYGNLLFVSCYILCVLLLVQRVHYGN